LSIGHDAEYGVGTNANVVGPPSLLSIEFLAEEGYDSFPLMIVRVMIGPNRVAVMMPACWAALQSELDAE